MAACGCAMASASDDEQHPKLSSDDSEILNVSHRQATELFRAIEKEDWDRVLLYLQTGKWSTSMFSFAGSEKTSDIVKQAKTWVTAYDANGVATWSQLPLHAAISYLAPHVVVQKLVETYPRSCQCTDHEGRLPIHLAFGFGAPDSVLAMLLERFPGGVNVRDRDGRFPFDCCELGPNKMRGRVYKIVTDQVMNRYGNELADQTWKYTHSSRKSSILNNDGEFSKMTTEDDIDDLKKELETLREDMKKLDGSKNNVEEIQATIAKGLQEAKGATDNELAAMKQQLETMFSDLKTNKTFEEVTELKKELTSLKNQMKQLEAVAETMNEVKELKATVEGELKLAKGENRIELNVMKKALDALFSNLSKSTTQHEVESLKSELISMKEEMKQYDFTSKTIKEVEELKRILDNEQDADVKSVRNSVNRLASELRQTQSRDQVLKLKENFDAIKLDLKKQEEAAKTKRDVIELQYTLEQELKAADDEAKGKLNQYKKTVDDVFSNIGTVTTTDEVAALREELNAVKRDLRIKDQASKLKADLLELKSTVEAAIKACKYLTVAEITQMNRRLSAIDESSLSNMALHQLRDVKIELEVMKKEVAQTSSERGKKRRKSKKNKNIFSLFRRKQKKPDGIKTAQTAPAFDFVSKMGFVDEKSDSDEAASADTTCSDNNRKLLAGAAAVLDQDTIPDRQLTLDEEERFTALLSLNKQDEPAVERLMSKVEQCLPPVAARRVQVPQNLEVAHDDDDTEAKENAVSVVSPKTLTDTASVQAENLVYQVLSRALAEVTLASCRSGAYGTQS